MSSNRIIRAFLWKFLEKIGTKGIQLIIQIVLARILFPDDYGMVAILAVFISLSNVFIQGGFNTSLIQKKEASDIDFSTVLYASFVIAFFSYLVLFIFAPDIAAFYHLPQLKELLRVYSLSLFAGVINSVQYAYISRKLQFRIYTVTMVCASGISGIIGIVLAYQGFGVWTLVLQLLLANFFAVLFLSLFIKWRPLMVFSFQSLRETFGYGWKILATGLINTLYLNIYSLIVGKVYNTELLGLYNRGDQFPNLIVNNINDTVQSVIFPVLSEQQENKEAIRWIMKKGLSLNVFIVVPAMLGLAAISRPLIQILLTEKWISAVPYMQLLCILYAFYPIHTMNIQCIKALGRSDIFLKLEIIKKIMEAGVLFLTVRNGLAAMILGQVGCSVVEIFLNTYPIGREIGYGTGMQLREIAPSILSSVSMMIFVLALGKMMGNGAVSLFLQIVMGMLFFFGCNLAIKNPAVEEIQKLVRRYWNGRTN